MLIVLGVTARKSDGSQFRKLTKLKGTISLKISTIPTLKDRKKSGRVTKCDHENHECVSGRPTTTSSRETVPVI